MFSSSLRAAIIATLATLALASNVSARSLETQTIRDWQVYCKDDRYCIASTTGTSADGRRMRFKLERSNKENNIIFVTTAPEEKLALGMKVTVSASGYDKRYSGAIQTLYDNNEMAFKERTDSALLDLLKKARFGTVSVDFGGNVGRVDYDVSYQGVTSVLALMDVVQGRLDRADAAVVVGGEAFTSTSTYDFAAAPAPEASQSDKATADLRDPEENIAVEADEESGLGIATVTYNQSDVPDRALMIGYRTLECDLPAAIEAFGASQVNIEPGVFLHVIPCQIADINVPYYVVMEDAGEIDLLEFQEAASETGDRVSLITNPWWDKSSDSLTMHQYYSPLADCGKHERHVFEPRENLFYLSEARIKENCDGTKTAPEAYPLSWNGEGD